MVQAAARFNPIFQPRLTNTFRDAAAGRTRQHDRDAGQALHPKVKTVALLSADDSFDVLGRQGLPAELLAKAGMKLVVDQSSTRMPPTSPRS